LKESEQVKSTSKKIKKEAAPLAPNGIKKPTTPYLLFFMEKH